VKITVDVHYGGLGADVEILLGFQNGSIDCIFDGADIHASLDPKLGVFALPFIFSNYDQLYAAGDGKAGQDLLARLESKGIIGLAYSHLGFRNFANNVRPISTPADVNGLKLRTIARSNPDGLGMAFPFFLSAKLYELVKCYSVSRQKLTAMAFSWSKSKWDTLSTAQQDVIKKTTFRSER